jgi:hypothetical protein
VDDDGRVMGLLGQAAHRILPLQGRRLASGIGVGA